MMSLEQLYCIVDDFCKIFMPSWKKYLIKSGVNQRNRKNQLTPSEIMTIMIHFHQSRFRNFKMYYVGFVQRYLKEAFPDLVNLIDLLN